MVKRYNQEQFVAVINGQSIVFNAWTTSTRYGFCHTVSCPSLDITDTKVSYCNRTWEEWTYKSVLSRAIEKCDKSMQEELKEILIEKKTREVTERCNAFVNAFKDLHNSLNEENKESLANSGIMMQSEEDAKAVMGLMGMMKIMQND